MWNQVKEIAIGDTVLVESLNHEGTVIDIKDGKVFSINDKNIVCQFSDRDKFKIIKKIGKVAKFILDLLFFLSKRPKLKGL